MTKHNVLTAKLALVSSIGVALTFFLINNAMTTSNYAVSFYSQAGAFVVGMFSLGGVIATLVYFLSTEEN